MSIFQQVSQDMIAAMKAKEVEKLSTLRMLSTALKNEAINQKVQELDDEAVMKIIKTEVKKRKDSITSYEEGGRQDLADAEKAEIVILEEYLPEQMSEEQISGIIDTVLGNLTDDQKSNFGVVMGMVMKEVGGNADGALVRGLLQQKLGK